MYSIRDSINDDDSVRALSLANDLYFLLLRHTVWKNSIICDTFCKGDIDEVKTGS